MVNGKSMRRKITAFDAFIYFIAVVFTAIVIFPFIHLIALSFNDGMDAMKGGIGFWPRKFTLENYKIILQESSLFRDNINQ